MELVRCRRKRRGCSGRSGPERERSSPARARVLPEDAEVPAERQRPLLLTINGIAAGLRSTG